MRRALGLAALALTLAAGAALAQELTAWDWKSGDPATAGYFETVKADFEAAHPGVTVKYVMQPQDQYYTLLGTALSSSGGPGMVLLHGGAQARERVGAMVSMDDKVADIISETSEIDRDTITPESHTIDDLGIDSLDFLDIVFAIDKEFGIKIPLERWTQEVNDGKVPTSEYFVMKNLCAKIDELVARKAQA